MKVFVRCSLFHQPLDRPDLGKVRRAALDQWVQLGAHAPGANHGNSLVIRELQNKLVFSPSRKNGMRIERRFLLQSFELLEKLIAF